MKKFKKYLALLMAGLLISASLVACNTDVPDDDNDEDEDEDKIVDVTTTDENDNDPDPDVTTTVKDENPDDDPPVVAEKTLDELIDDMKDADKLTVEMEEDGYAMVVVFDGNKIKASIEDVVYYYEIGDENRMYVEYDGEWYYGIVGDDEIMTVEMVTEGFEVLSDVEIEVDGDTYTVTGKDAAITATYVIEFKGSVTIPDATPVDGEEEPDEPDQPIENDELEALFDDMKAADQLTVKIDEDGFIMELIYDGNKIKEVISDGSDSVTYYYEVGDECLAYMELEGTWYYAPVDEADVVTVEWLTELIPELLNIEIEEASDAYVITAEDENGVASTITVEFEGSVTIPEDAVSAD